jgi:hypothetical protein
VIQSPLYQQTPSPITGSSGRRKLPVNARYRRMHKMQQEHRTICLSTSLDCWAEIRMETQSGFGRQVESGQMCNVKEPLTRSRS